jgi:RNA polymerase sigma-70 factor (ECF subfamily)
MTNVVAAAWVDGPPGEDRELLARLRAGEAAAYEDLVRRCAPRMLAVATRLLRSEADGADAVQDAFVSAFRGLGSFAGQSSLATWLHRIVINSCLMKLRSRSRRRDIPLDDLLPGLDEAGLGPAAPSRQEQAYTALERSETRARVRRCIDELPEGYRAVVLLRDIEELDTDETARQLGMTAGAVKTRLHRARQALRVLLEAGRDEPDAREA